MSNKWDTLTHNGVLFPSEYEHQKLPVTVQGKELVLSKEAEEVAVMWAQKYETPYIKDKTFQKNYWTDFKQYLPDNLQSTKFPEDWDFTQMYLALLRKKEQKKVTTKEEREHDKKQKEALKKTYGYAILNGKEVPLANYVVEPPGIFMGRGDAPKRGCLKPRVRPEDITLNLSKNAPVPPAPKGHTWGKVVENKNALWTAMWIDRVMGRQKRVLFSPVSEVRQGSDQKKFAKALMLTKNFDTVLAFIDKKLKSADPLTRELATACKIIAKLTIRVGDEKSEDEADTRGCSTLVVKDIKLLGNKVEFDFLGKDSVRYHNIVDFDAQTIANLQELISGKKKDDQIFEHISSHDINEFLSIVIPGLTAKQFRTSVGSRLLAEELRKKDISSEKEIKKLQYFNEANLEVAIQLNHQSAVTEAYDTGLKKMKETLVAYKKELTDFKKEYEATELAVAKMRDERIAYAKEKYKGTKQKEAIARAKETYKKESDKLSAKLERIKDRVDVLTTKIKMKEKMKGIALSTSKTNYSDPRIGISWCKKNDVPIEKLYTKTLLEKFSWAQDIDEDFYLNYPDVE